MCSEASKNNKMTKTVSTRKSSSRCCKGRSNVHKKRSREERRWSDLPSELLDLIARQCFFADQIRFNAVCKSWRSISGVQPAKQLPWLMALDERLCFNSCKLFDPISKRTHSITMKRNFESVQVCSSKSGWLLLSQPNYPAEATTSFFLYNPFVDKVIELPDLNGIEFNTVASFSSDPTSSDCVLFVLLLHGSNTIINTRRPGDKTWTKHAFNGHFEAIGNVVYSQGSFYCVNRRGRVGIFNVDRSDWCEHDKPEPILVLPDYEFKTCLVESFDGEILMVLLSSRGVWTRIFKLNRGSTTMDWIKVEDIGDRVLFLGDHTSLSVSAASVVMPRNIGTIGKIYYISGKDTRLIYSSKDGSRSYLCSKHYGSLAKEKCLTKIWIQPPH